MDLEFECPFWAQQLLCADGTKCFVGTCKEDEVINIYIYSKHINLDSSNLDSKQDRFRFFRKPRYC